MIEKISDFIISFLPSTPVFFIIYLVFMSIFFILLIFILSRKKSKKNKSLNKLLTIEDLINISKNNKSTTKDLIFVLEYFLNYFKVKEDKTNSFELFKLVLNHKNRSKKLFDIYHNKIVPLNKEYKNELNRIEKEALTK